MSWLGNHGRTVARDEAAAEVDARVSSSGGGAYLSSAFTTSRKSECECLTYGANVVAYLVEFIGDNDDGG